MIKYIDADKAKNDIMKFVNEYGEIVGMFVNDFNILLERCAVDVQEVKHGRWEELMEHRGAGGILGGKDICVGYACSECGEQSDIMTYYCPTCGASMQGEEE